MISHLPGHLLARLGEQLEDKDLASFVQTCRSARSITAECLSPRGAVLRAVWLASIGRESAHGPPVDSIGAALIEQQRQRLVGANPASQASAFQTFRSGLDRALMAVGRGHETLRRPLALGDVTPFSEVILGRNLPTLVTSVLENLEPLANCFVYPRAFQAETLEDDAAGDKDLTPCSDKRVRVGLGLDQSFVLHLNLNVSVVWGEAGEHGVPAACPPIRLSLCGLKGDDEDFWFIYNSAREKRYIAWNFKRYFETKSFATKVLAGLTHSHRVDIPFYSSDAYLITRHTLSPYSLLEGPVHCRGS